MSTAPRQHRVACAALLFLLLGSAGVAGCGPSGAAAAEPTAESPALPPEKPVVILPPARASKPAQPEPVGGESPQALPSYVLPFEARANPFAPPKPKPGDRPGGATAQATEVKLVGLMRTGPRTVAVIEIDGKQFFTSAGTSLEPSPGVAGLRVLEIRESEIVVEQGGRQWIVALPRP